MSWNLKQRCDLPGQAVDGRDFRRESSVSEGTEASERVTLRKQLLGSVPVAQLHRKAEWESTGAETQ